MINLAVINLKTLIRKIIKIIIAILIVAMIIKFVRIIYTSIKKFDIQNLSTQKSVNLINDNLAISNNFEKDEKHVHSSGLKKILISQLAVFSGSDEQNEEEENEGEIMQMASAEEKKDDSTIQTESQAISESTEPVIQPVVNQTMQTSVIENHNKKDVYTDIYNTVKIKNESNYSLTQEMVTPNINYSNNAIIIYHTHTCESYTPTENSQYVASRKL